MLEISDLQVAYGGVTAVHGISLSVEEGGIVSLIGSNGAGKSSTLRAIIGLVKPRSGEIVFSGERIEEKSTPDIVARGIALAPEGRRVFPFMSVRENLLIGAYLQSKPAVVRDMLDRIFRHFPRLAERSSQAAGSLSGGEQQMLAIGRALMAQPKLLLLDEPSLGLAPKMVSEIGKIIIDIKRDERISVVLVEQNANLALSICDKAYVLETGTVVMEGEGEELRNSSYVQRAYLGV